MRKLLSVCLLILCMSFPVFGGHALGGGRWCDCDDPTSHYQGMRIEHEESTQHDADTEISHLEMYLETLSMLLRVSFSLLEKLDFSPLSWRLNIGVRIILQNYKDSSGKIVLGVGPGLLAQVAYLCYKGC